jgi:hypothetical protein
MQVSALTNTGGKSLMGIIKRIFPLMMTTELERQFSLEKPREGKMAFKPLQLFRAVCSKLHLHHIELLLYTNANEVFCPFFNIIGYRNGVGCCIKFVSSLLKGCNSTVGLINRYVGHNRDYCNQKVFVVADCEKIPTFDK